MERLSKSPDAAMQSRPLATRDGAAAASLRRTQPGLVPRLAGFSKDAKKNHGWLGPARSDARPPRPFAPGPMHHLGRAVSCRGQSQAHSITLARVPSARPLPAAPPPLLEIARMATSPALPRGHTTPLPCGRKFSKDRAATRMLWVLDVCCGGRACTYTGMSPHAKVAMAATRPPYADGIIAPPPRDARDSDAFQRWHPGRRMRVRTDYSRAARQRSRCGARYHICRQKRRGIVPGVIPPVARAAPPATHTPPKTRQAGDFLMPFPDDTRPPPLLHAIDGEFRRSRAGWLRQTCETEPCWGHVARHPKPYARATKTRYFFHSSPPTPRRIGPYSQMAATAR